MHDQSLEQRLRGALQAEGDRLPLTITAAELERRHALRHRSGPSRFASLGLAAAIGVALLGLAGVAGGWFERSNDPLPIASASASPSPGAASPSVGPSPVAPAILPGLDELLGELDPGAIVGAQGAGPATGAAPEGIGIGGPLGPGSTTLSPVAANGSYRLWSACLGERLTVTVVRALGVLNAPDVEIPITCDGQTTARQIGLGPGDAIRVSTDGASAWRLVLELPGRSAPRPASFEPLPPPVPDVEEEHARADSAISEPSYADLGVAVPRVTQRYASLPVRDHYEVLVSCAGPTSVGYALGNAVTGTGTSLDGTFITEVSGEVSCDGLVHRDVFDLALASGAELYVSADEQTAWSVAVNGDAPPIGTEPDGSDWTMSSAIGPMLDLDGSVQLTTLIGADDGGDIRVVIACEGDGPLKIAVDTGPVEGVNVDRFELACEAGSTATIRKEYRKASPSVTISMDPGGRRMWLAATVQVRPSSP